MSMTLPLLLLDGEGKGNFLPGIAWFSQRDLTLDLDHQRKPKGYP